MKKTVLIGTALLLVQIPLLALVLLQERTWGGSQFDEGSGVATAPDNSVTRRARRSASVPATATRFC